MKPIEYFFVSITGLKDFPILAFNKSKLNTTLRVKLSTFNRLCSNILSKIRKESEELK